MPRRYTFTREQLNAFLQRFNDNKLFRHAYFDTSKTVVTPQIVSIGTNDNVVSIINPDGNPTFDPADVTTSGDVKAAFHDALSHNFKADVPRSVYDFIIQNTEFYEPGAAVGGAGGAGGGNPTTGPGTSPNRSLWGTPSTPGSTTGDPTAAAAAPTAESDPYTFSSSPGRRNRKVRRTRRNRRNNRKTRRSTRRYRTKQNRY